MIERPAPSPDGLTDLDYKDVAECLATNLEIAIRALQWSAEHPSAHGMSHAETAATALAEIERRGR